jgi:hypothetical protein
MRYTRGSLLLGLGPVSPSVNLELLLEFTPLNLTDIAESVLGAAPMASDMADVPAQTETRSTDKDHPPYRDHGFSIAPTGN